MKIAPETGLVERARGGELAALDALLQHIQDPVYNLAVRMLGNRENAQDATQEVLLKVITHLATWRGDSAFGTWVFRIAANHMLNTKTRSLGRQEISFDMLGEALDRGIAFGQRSAFDETAMSPEDRLTARQTALSCTQAMLMALDAPGRLAYVLDVIFGLESPDAAQVQGVTPAAHRQRLARARASLQGFMEQRCGLVSSAAHCRCVRQVPAKRAAAARVSTLQPQLKVDREELDAAEIGLRELIRMSDAAAVMRGAPAYAAPHAMLQGIRLIIEQSSLFFPKAASSTTQRLDDNTF
jgi:RNA polymerase sigma factor (sigma-70 family)